METKDPSMAESFAKELFLMNPGTCIEIRCFGAKIDYQRNMVVRSENEKSIVSGWFTHPGHISNSVKKMFNVSAYMTINPVSISGRPKEMENKFGYLKKGCGCGDNDITKIEWVILDIDPRSGGRKRGNSTDEELGACLEVARAIAGEAGMSEHMKAGISGNGAFVLVKVGLENSPSNKLLIHNYVNFMSTKYSNEKAHIDKMSFVPSKMIGIPGSIKYKSVASTDERPYRRVRIID